MSERKKSGELENQGPVSEALEGKGQENAGVDANQAAETGMEAEAAAPETEETAVDAADDKAAVADAGALPDDDEVYEEEPEAPVEAESETETPPTEEPPAEEPKPRRRRTTRNAEGDAAAEARPTRRRSAASTGEPTEAQKLERERREDNINRMLRSQQRAERNEKNQKFYAGISALQEAMRRKLILHGTVASVEQLSVANTGAAAQRVTTMLGVILDGRFKVLIPFAEFYRDNPIDMSKVDLKSGEGVENFNRRQRQLAERLYGCNIDFVVTHVEVTDPNDYRIAGSRRQAMEILEMRNYVSANDGDPYIHVGDVRDADIISVGAHGLFCNVAGVDVSIPLRDVTFQYVTNLNDLYKSGDKIEVDIMDISRRADGRVELAVSAKAAELRDAKERQAGGFIPAGTATVGIITSIRRSQRDPDKIVIHAYLPHFKMPAVVASMNPNTLAAAPQAGDYLRLVVTGFSDSGFVRANCRGFHNVINLVNR